MTEKQELKQDNISAWRFRAGLFFFVLGWLCPLFIPLVTSSNLETELKALISGILLIGVPEVFSVISIIILGKSGFNTIKLSIFAFFKRAAPSGQVSRTRYRVGLFILLLHVIYAYFTFYIPDLIPGYIENRVPMNLTADFLFIVTLFILGGDFWEKLRGLLLYDAKTYIPKKSSNDDL
jgi:hypothetical protein